MRLFAPAGLAISLPGAELAGLELPGSVTDPDAVLARSLSQDLRAALGLVLDECQRRQVPVQIVARPEIFTHGSAERWLRDRLGDITQHLCISDGTTIKPIAGCQTHVFFYHLSRHANLAALQRLCARAPELVACIESQVNTALAFGVGNDQRVPEPYYLTDASAIPRPKACLMPFFLNTHSAQDTVNRIEMRGALQDEQIPQCAKTVYMPLTETALYDTSFARAVAETIIDAIFYRDTLLVLRLPPAENAPHSLAAQIQTVLPCLRDTGVTIPHGCPPNVLLATDDLREDVSILARRPWTMIFHESFDFWRHTKAFYRQAERVLVMTAPHEAVAGTFLPLDVEPLFGPRATRVWLRRSASA
jgi:hypothetical protein